MPTLQYPYQQRQEHHVDIPIATVIVRNPENDRFLPPLRLVLDTGADCSTLRADLMPSLGLDRQRLQQAPITGMGRKHTEVGWMAWLSMAFFDAETGEEHYPNGNDPIPVVFIEDLRDNVAGRSLFLNKCHVAFDGISRVVTVTF